MPLELTSKTREYLYKKSQELAAQFYSYTISGFDEDPNRIIESPVEQLFYIEWRFREFSDDEFKLKLTSQYQEKSTGKYKIDFVINFVQEIFEWSLGQEIEDKIFKIPVPKLGIEIDSHIWHEKTKEQAQYDKERERFLIAQGWKLLRFTGREVFRDPANCVNEVLEIAEEMQYEYHQKIREKIYA